MVDPLDVEEPIGQLDRRPLSKVAGARIERQRGEQTCAAVVLARGEVDVVDLSARVRTQRLAYKVPTRWAVDGADQLPVPASGKLDRKAVKKMIADGVLPSVTPP